MKLKWHISEFILSKKISKKIPVLLVINKKKKSIRITTVRKLPMVNLLNTSKNFVRKISRRLKTFRLTVIGNIKTMLRYFTEVLRRLKIKR